MQLGDKKLVMQRASVGKNPLGVGNSLLWTVESVLPGATVNTLYSRCYWNLCTAFKMTIVQTAAFKTDVAVNVNIKCMYFSLLVTE